MKSLKIKFIYTLFFLPVVFSYSYNQTEQQKIERRAVIDIGSQGTKITVADIDVTSKKLRNIVFSASQEVGYKNDITQQQDASCFSEGIIQKGINAINNLKQQTQTLNPAPSNYFAFATASLRAVPCAEDLLKRIELETGVPTRIISQKEEGRLAFEGSVAAAQVPRKNAVVWEIGGGSMQITTLDDKTGNLISYGNTYGMIPFRNLLLAQIHHKTPQQTITLNPFSYNDEYKAIKLSELIAGSVPQEIKEKVSRPETQVLGTGIIGRIARIATHNPKATYVSLDQLEEALSSELTYKTDQETLRISKEIEPASIFIPITGLVLLIGYMKALGIKKIKLVKGGISQGALVEPIYFS